MRVLGLALLLASTAASAQAPVAPAWRLGVSIGATSEPMVATALSVERAVTGPLAAGARAARYGPALAEDYDVSGGTAEVFVTAAPGGGGPLDLRGIAGVGVSSTRAGGGFSAQTAQRTRAMAFVGLGLDVYPVAALGVGLEGRLAVAGDGPSPSELSVGLRVRFGR